MVDIDEVLAAAIRAIWLHVDGPMSLSRYRVGVEAARRVRVALEREGVIITEARPMPEAGWISVQPNGLAKRQPPRRTADR
jgi:hypothetical protein